MTMKRGEHRKTGNTPATAAIAAGMVLTGALVGMLTGTLMGPVMGPWAAPPAAAQTPAGTAATTAFESPQLRYAVALPAGCRHEEGPGTIDAVCAPDFDPGKSAVAAKSTALVLGVAAEPLGADTDTTIAGLQQRFGAAAFREDLPEAVCGESDKARVKIENLKETVEDARLVYSADVVCAPAKFLQIGERRAAVRHVMTSEMRYRLVARAPVEDFEKQGETINAFLASFRVLSTESATRAEK